eukprot:4955291-Pyramimonas_sp.AAC.1
MNFAVPGGMRIAKLSPGSRGPGGPAVRRRTRIRIGPRRPWGEAAVCESVANFEGCWRAQRIDAIRRPTLDLAIPGGL